MRRILEDWTYQPLKSGSDHWIQIVERDGRVEIYHSLEPPPGVSEVPWLDGLYDHLAREMERKPNLG